MSQLEPLKHSPFKSATVAYLRSLRRLPSDRKGAVAVLVGVAFVGLIGFAGLGTEVGVWYSIKRSMQGAADSGAFSAAIAAGNGQAFATEAKSTTAAYGFVDRQGGVAVTVNRPPASGSYAGKQNAIEVLIQQPQPRLLSALFLSTNPTIGSRAVALAGNGNDCVLALNQNASGAISGAGTTNVNLIKCGIGDDSGSGSALSLVGGASIAADSASIVGNTSVGNNSSFTTVNPIVTGSGLIPDPYQNVAIPSYSGCDYNNFNSIHGSKSADAGNGIKVICGGIKIVSGGALSLSNGVFILDGGSIDVAGGATFNITNATIILTSSTGSNWGTVTINGGAVITVVAPTSGATAGIAFYQDRSAPSGTVKFNGGSTQNITGVLYFPTQTVKYTGGVQTGTGCTQIVADQVAFSGNSIVESNCTGKGVQTIAAIPKLVE